jgi:putative phosphoesterase
MDSPAVREAFPGKRVFPAGRFRIGLVHGWGPPDGIEERLALAFRDDPVDCLVYGHTHRPANHLRNGVLFFNPGSAGGGFTARRTVGILEITDRIAGSIIELEDGTS